MYSIISKIDRLLTAKIHIGIEQPHDLCDGAIDGLIDKIECELEMGLKAVAASITEKFGKYEDGGKGTIKVVVEI
jgi:hypothetical protein